MGENTKYIIEIQNVGRTFSTASGDFQALKGVNANIPEGMLTILKGRSGSGKTTLLNIVGALDNPTTGRVVIEGQDVGKLSAYQKENLRRKKIGFVFQSVSLIPSMNAFQNVEFSMRMAGIRGDHKKRVEECLKMVGLGSRMHHMPSEMSGGEQQRVAIARAIAHGPSIILADEPTAELDSAMAAEVTKLFQEMTRREHVTIVMTTHDVGLMDAGDMVIELENGMQISHNAEPEAMEAQSNGEAEAEDGEKSEAQEYAEAAADAKAKAYAETVAEAFAESEAGAGAEAVTFTGSDAGSDAEPKA
ncbi:MAG: ABC transporter ATP-binding protein [Lachnospiraceae bacterium]|nr:ABC transporter ATP-binding protein [Lachnospiraceae bacterium]MBP5263623.1 ABC transporter ATP-binding protein [Lachnospiraceae bacterium]